MADSDETGVDGSRNDRIKKLAVLLDSLKPWDIADVVVALRDEDKLKLSEIVKAVADEGAKGYTVPYFSQVYLAAKTYPPAARFKDLTYTAHFKAAVAFRQINSSLKRRGVAPLDPVEHLKGVLAEGGDVSRSVRKIMRQLRQSIENPVAPLPTTGLLNDCHHGDCVVLAAEFEDRCIPLVWMDPPYGHYVRTKDGRLDESTSAYYTDHDNGTEEDAVRVTCDAIRAYEPKLLIGGMMLLWQADKLMRPEITQTIRDANLICVNTLVWKKPTRTGLGNYDSPFQQSKEFCYVLMRKGDKYRVLNGEKATPDVFEIDLILAEPDGQPHHMFEKPMDLCRMLLKATTKETECVADVFGCSASMCKAAIELGRSWVYIESNAVNFKRFAGIVQKMRDEAKRPEGDDEPEAMAVAA